MNRFKVDNIEGVMRFICSGIESRMKIGVGNKIKNRKNGADGMGLEASAPSTEAGLTGILGEISIYREGGP